MLTVSSGFERRSCVEAGGVESAAGFVGVAQSMGEPCGVKPSGVQRSDVQSSGDNTVSQLIPISTVSLIPAKKFYHVLEAMSYL